MNPPLTPDDVRILRLTYERVHPSIEQIHHVLFPTRSRRAVLNLVRSLSDRSLISAKRLHPEQGARSPRYLRLTHKGARAIGIAKLSGQHYRMESDATQAARQARMDLLWLAQAHGWRLSHDEREAQLLLSAYLREIADGTAGRPVPAHTLRAYLPARISPDQVLDTPHEALLCVLAHPQAGRPFWRARLRRYAATLLSVRLVALCLTAKQESELRQVLARTEARLRGRILVLPVAQLHALADFLR